MHAWRTGEPYPRSLSRDPGQVLFVCTWLFADSCLCSLQNTSLILDRNCCGRLSVSPVAVLLSTLQLSKYYRKQDLLASSPPSRDRQTNPGTHSLQKVENNPGTNFLRRNPLGGLLNRSYLPIIVGDTVIMAHYLSHVKGFLKDFCKFTKIEFWTF